MRQRALSAAIFVPPLLVILVLGGPWIAAMILIAVAFAAFEAMRLLGAAGYPVLVGLGMAIALAFVADAAVSVELTGSAALLIAVAAILAAVGGFGQGEPRDGIGKTFGHRFGELTGRTNFLAHISPSKTYAGLIGGLVAATIVMVVGLWAAGAPAWQGLVIGPVLGLAAQAGDLAESVLKRAAGAKDSSSLIPGHGGILDRVDSFLFAAPVLTLYVLTFLR